jgi:DNA invertase Pin-like site-specific DNA recombinase
MRPAVYIRFSSSSQNEDSQRFALDQYLASNGVQNASYYVDCSTGDNLDRPEFERLQRDVMSRKIDAIYVFKLDRISRTLVEGIVVLAHWIKAGIKVVAISQNLCFEGPVGSLIASVLFGLAEIEQSTRRDRQRAGIAAAKAKGAVYLGRKIGSTKKKPARAIELRNKGLSVDEIAVAMNVSKRTVFNYLAKRERDCNGEKVNSIY